MHLYLVSIVALHLFTGFKKFIHSRRMQWDHCSSVEGDFGHHSESVDGVLLVGMGVESSLEAVNEAHGSII